MTQRWGLIGFGRFGQLHAGSIERTAGTELAAIATSGEVSAAQARAAHPTAMVTTDWTTLLDHPTLDVVDIVAPNHLHAEMAIQALEAGKNVLVEKPLGTSIVDCDRLVETVERTGRLLSVGLELRLSVQWGRIKQLIDTDRIGRPRMVHISLFRHPYRDGAGGWRQRPEQVGSWILEEPVHFYDLAMWYLAALGDPVSVAAHGTAAEAPGMFDHFTSSLRFADGGCAVITQSLAGFGHHLVVEIGGTTGAIRATWSAGDAGSETPNFDLFLGSIGMTPPERLAVDGQSGEVFELEEQIRLTSEAFAAGRALVDVGEGRKSVLVCLEAERAVRENREIALDFS